MSRLTSGPNWRGLWALIRRGLLRYLRSLPEMAGGTAGMGLLFLLVFSVALPEGTAFQPGVDALQFLVPGLIAWGMFSSAFDNVGFPLLFDRMEGMIQDVMMAPLSPLERLAGYVLPGICCGLITGAIMLALFSVFIDIPLNAPWRSAGFALVGCVLFALIGSLTGLWAEKWDQFALVENFLVLPLGLLSGTFFTLDSLPDGGQLAILGNPVFHIIDGFRSGFTGTLESTGSLSPLLAFLPSLFLLYFTWRLFARGYRVTT
ncbi:MAG: ABC transporter permease [Pseudomonadota bacterium]